jgi:RHS repeat-associated protein
MRFPRSFLLLIVIAYGCVLTGWGTVFLGIDQIALARPSGPTTPAGENGFPRTWEGGISVSPHAIVNLRSGTVTTAIPVASWTHRTLSVAFNLYHNSFGATQSITSSTWPGLISPGKGWSTSYSGSVFRWSELVGMTAVHHATVIEDDGTRNDFIWDGTYWQPPVGIHDRLREDVPSTDWFTLTRPDQSKRVFDNTGKLREEINTAGLKVTIERHPTYSPPDILIKPEGQLGTTAFRIVLHSTGRPLSVEVSNGTGSGAREYSFGYGEREWDDCANDYHCTEEDCDGTSEDSCGLAACLDSTSYFNWFVYPPRAGFAADPPCVGAGRLLSFRYNSGGTISEILERDGNRWTYDYGSVGSMIASVTQHPIVTRGASDIVQSFAFCVPSISTQCVKVFKGLTLASISTYTDPRDNDWHSAYDSSRRQIATSNPANNVNLLDYDADNNVTSRIDPLNREWTTTYGPVGNPTSWTTPLSTTQATTADYEVPSGEPADSNFYRLTTTTYPDGWETEFLYESTIDPTKVTTIREQADGQGSGTADTVIEYTPADTNSGNYNPKGMIKSVTDANGVRTEWAYDKDAYSNFRTNVNEGVIPVALRGTVLNPVNTGDAFDQAAQNRTSSLDNVICSGQGGMSSADGRGDNGGCLVPDNFLRGNGLPFAPPRLAVADSIPSPEIPSVKACGANSGTDPNDLRDPVGRTLTWESCTGDATERVTNWTYDDPFKRLSARAITSDEPGFELTRTFSFPSYDEAGNVLSMTGSDGRVLNYEYDYAGRVTAITRPVGMSTLTLAENFYDAAGRLEASVAANGAITFYTYDDADRLTDIQHVQSKGGGGDQLARVHYTWTINNLVSQRDEYTSTDPEASPSAVVEFTYDLRGRLIREERVSTGSDDYDFSYTYDQVGNRLTKTDNLNDKRVRYLYDVTDEENCPEGFVTKNNRLMKYIEETLVSETWVPTRDVAYTYYRTGHASNITIKDATSDVYRDLATYYDVQGRLSYALWDSWEVYTSGEDAGLPIPATYVKSRAVEFRYDNTDARQRYMMRELDTDELPEIVPLTSPMGQWVDYSGSSPFADAEYTHGTSTSFEVTREYDPTVEREVGADELHLHGDLIGSTIAATDEDEVVAGRQVYTAFGEPVGTPTLSGTRYRYAGEWGYEEGLLTLDGASGTAPIALLHLGERWYQPGIGRFVQRDPIGLMGGANCYLYAGANPIALIDPSGRNPIDDVNDFIARNFWQRIFSEDHLANMGDGEMYAWGIGVPVAVGAGVAGCMLAGEALAAKRLQELLDSGDDLLSPDYPGLDFTPSRMFPGDLPGSPGYPTLPDNPSRWFPFNPSNN